MSQFLSASSVETQQNEKGIARNKIKNLVQDIYGVRILIHKACRNFHEKKTA